MKRTISLLKFIVIALFFLSFRLFGQSQTVDTILPLDVNHWLNMDCGQLTQIGDTLRVYGSEYRIGGNIHYKDFFNFQNEGEAYFKWYFINGSGPIAKMVRINGIPSPQLLRNFLPGVWYYVHIKINADHTADFNIATGNYHDQGGNTVQQEHYILNDNKWNMLKSTNVALRIWDNYGGTNSYLDVTEVRLKNVIPVPPQTPVSTQLLEFEDGQIPALIHPVETDWTIDSNTGFNSSHSLYVEAPPVESRSVYIDLPAGILSVSFDVMYKADTHKPAYVVIDSTAYANFDKSQTDCWKHYKWVFNDNLPHRIYWKIQGNSYGNNNGQLWLDNIELKYDHNVNVPDRKKEISVYPNPVTGYIFIRPTHPTLVQLIDNNGKVLLKKLFKTPQAINISSFAPGIYLLKYKDSSGMPKVYKIIKR